MQNIKPAIEQSMASFPLKQDMGDGLVLRVIVPEDAEAIVGILQSNEDLQEHVGWLHDIETVEEIKHRIQQFRDGKRLRYVLTKDSQIVGYVGLMLHMESQYENEGELGYFLTKEVRGQGLAVKSVRTIIDLAEKLLPLKSFRVFIEDDNKASIRVANALQFERTDDMRENLFGKMERRYVRNV